MKKKKLELDRSFKCRVCPGTGAIRLGGTTWACIHCGKSGYKILSDGSRLELDWGR